MIFKNITNPVFKELIKYNLVKTKNLRLFNDKTRDKKIKSFFDLESGVIFLEKYQRNTSYYKSKKTNRSKKTNKSFSSFKIKKKDIKTSNLNDDLRRFNQFKKILKNKNILDFGCGKGNFLKYCKPEAARVCGVELNKPVVKKLNKEFLVEDTIDKFNNKSFDVITCFHVLEHLPDPILMLKKLFSKLNDKGILILEVPSAHDLLLSVKNLKEFRDFTMWSEHLMLYTNKSLTSFIKAAGGKKIDLKFYQRYNLSNHFGWFVNRLPGGHDSNYFPKNLNDSYQKYLVKIKKTDTLIAVVKK